MCVVVEHDATCVLCTKPAELACPCMARYFCSKDCQETDWVDGEHYLVCNRLQLVATNTNSGGSDSQKKISDTHASSHNNAVTNTMDVTSTNRYVTQHSSTTQHPEHETTGDSEGQKIARVLPLEGVEHCSERRMGSDLAHTASVQPRRPMHQMQRRLCISNEFFTPHNGETPSRGQIHTHKNKRKGMNHTKYGALSQDASPELFTVDAERRMWTYTLNDPPIRRFGCAESSYGNDHLTQADRTRNRIEHNDEKPYECTWEGCGGKPYVCELTECRKRFKSRQGLDYHVKIHSGEKNFACPVPSCTTSFLCQNDLNRHIKTHQNGKSYECPMEGCIKRFKSRQGRTTLTILPSH
eukprot:CFRG2061T1